MLTTTGWCAGRPADYLAGTDEYDLALQQAEFYRNTTAVREFRTGRPSPDWWRTQTLGAVSDFYAAMTPKQRAAAPPVDVVLSWDQIIDAPIRDLLSARPDWVNRAILLGRHEPEVKISTAQFVEEMRYLRAQVGPRGDYPGVLLGPALILYRARIGAPGDAARYLAPLVDQDLVDFIAWDGYPSDPSEAQPTKPAHYESAQSFSTLPRRWATESGLPYAWAELHHGRVASDKDGRGSARWHAEIYRRAREDSALFVTQFHYSGGDFLRPTSQGTPVTPRTVEADSWAAVCQEAWACRQAALWADDQAVNEYNAGYKAALLKAETAIRNLYRPVVDSTD